MAPATIRPTRGARPSSVSRSSRSPPTGAISSPRSSTPSNASTPAPTATARAAANRYPRRGSRPSRPRRSTWPASSGRSAAELRRPGGVDRSPQLTLERAHRISGSGWTRGAASVAVAGGCSQFDEVPAVDRDGLRGPARRFFGVVARDAQSLGVLSGGGTAARRGLDVVDVSDRRAAIRRAAVLIAVGDESAEQAGDESLPGAHGDHFAGGRVGVELPQPHRRLVGDPGDEIAGGGGRDGSVAVEHRRFAVAV